MATLYVENVPDDLYDALRRRAKEHRRSIAAEVLSMLEENVPTKKELARRRNIFERIERLNSGRRSEKAFPSTEEMIREDRNR
jgi:plasmid stability protein